MTTPASSTAQSGYVPGVCNINRAETAYRRRVGYIALVIAVILTLGMLLIAAIPRLARVILFLPYFISFICLLQARNHFCVSYAASGQQNATDGGSAANITNATHKTADKKKAEKMNMQAAFAAGLLTAALALVPAL